jgi:NAD(P)H-dependent FMN reductase
MSAQPITIICGTNRNQALSKEISLVYQDLLNEMEVTSVILDLGDLPPDFIETALYDKAGKNEAFNPFRAQMKETQKMVFIVPEYNGSFPGVLKAFIDGLEYPGTFKNKKCALVGLSSGTQGGGLALSHLTDIFNYCGMHVMALKVKLARIEANFKDGVITNKLYEDLLREQASDFVQF